MVPGVRFMTQGRWGWGAFYCLLALVIAIHTLFIGYFILDIIAAIHSGALGDAKKNTLSEEDIRKLAEAMRQQAVEGESLGLAL
jgi:hypothetical protein